MFFTECESGSGWNNDNDTWGWMMMSIGGQPLYFRGPFTGKQLPDMICVCQRRRQLRSWVFPLAVQRSEKQNLPHKNRTISKNNTQRSNWNSGATNRLLRSCDSSNRKLRGISTDSYVEPSDRFMIPENGILLPLCQIFPLQILNRDIESILLRCKSLKDQQESSSESGEENLDDAEIDRHFVMSELCDVVWPTWLEQFHRSSYDWK